MSYSHRANETLAGVRSKYGGDSVVQIKAAYEHFRMHIRRALDAFRRLWREGAEEDLFAELAFCLFTPQSRARACWQAVERLCERNLLLHGTAEQIATYLTGVRFHNQKARRLVEARALFAPDGILNVRSVLAPLPDAHAARDWLVRHVCGLGYKEASHFLRNIGYSFDLAILDRHILRCLHRAGILSHLPKSLTPRRYLQAEAAMTQLSDGLGISIAELDLTIWAMATGEVFK